MDFGSWSPSHLIIAGLALATIIGQAIAVLVRLKSTTERLEKQIDKQSENMRQMGETFFHALEPVLKSKRLFPSAVDLAIHCEPHWGVAVDSPKPSGLKTKSLSLI